MDEGVEGGEEDTYRVGGFVFGHCLSGVSTDLAAAWGIPKYLSLYLRGLTAYRLQMMYLLWVNKQRRRYAYVYRDFNAFIALLFQIGASLYTRLSIDISTSMHDIRSTGQQ